MDLKYVFFLYFSFFLLLELRSSTAQTSIQAGYWFPASEFPIPDINSSLFTHLICAFADVDPQSYHLNISSSNHPFFSTFTNIVQQKNPSILTLLSIGGGTANYTIFSSMVSQPSSRKAFIDSSIKIARLYGFHGLDLCWVSPSTLSDMTNMGTLFDEWRTAVDSESRDSGNSSLILSVAVHYSPRIDSEIFPVDSIRRNMDWANILAYDYYMPSLVNFTGAHAALYDPSSEVSTDYGIGSWIDMGLSAKKLVLALPFYGYAWTLQNPGNHGLGAAATGPAIEKDGAMRYIDIKEFIQSERATLVYNANMVVNYCYVNSTWIGFDDVDAITAKVSYVKEKGLLGYFVWHVANDDNWVLAQAAQVGITSSDRQNDKDEGNNTQLDRERNNEQTKKRQLMVIIMVPTALVMLLLGSLMCYLRRRSMLKQKGTKKTTAMEFNNENKFGEDENNDQGLQVFSFGYIASVTDDFSDANKLGQGGFGPVYKGKLIEGQEIAVKRLSRSSGQGLVEFKNEITLIAKLQHVNLVRILGCCIEAEEKILIYEYMPNKSLDSYIFDPIRQVILDWRKRVYIIEGIAQGILYLHKYSRLRVIHRDLKASNILLDSEMNPKISDFGMARIFGQNESQANTKRVVGTYGYMPPEYAMNGIFSVKSDVYSFGVLLLEILSGKKNTWVYDSDGYLNLQGYAWELWKEGRVMELMDPILDDASSPCKLMRCIHVAFLCVQERPKDRPTMLDVVSMLNNKTEVLPTPKQPAFSTGIGIGAMEDDKMEEDGSTSRPVTINDVTISVIDGR